jgi:putative membrane protein
MKTSILASSFAASFVLACLLFLVSCSRTLTYPDALHANQKNFSTAKQQADAAFLVEAQSFNLLETRLAELAIQNGYSADLVKFARARSKDAKSLSATLRGLSKSEKVALPASMKSEHQGLVSQLENEERAEFDTKFVELMKEIIEENTALYERQATDANDGDIRAYAARKLGMYRSNSEELANVGEQLMHTQR